MIPLHNSFFALFSVDNSIKNSDILFIFFFKKKKTILSTAADRRQVRPRGSRQAVPLAFCATRRLARGGYRRPLEGTWCHLSNLIFTYKYGALRTFPLTRKDDPRGGGWSFQLASPLPWLGPSSSAWSCRVWRSGLGLELRRDRAWRRANWPHSPSSCRVCEGARTKKPISRPAGRLVESCQHLGNLLNFVGNARIDESFDSFGHHPLIVPLR